MFNVWNEFIVNNGADWKARPSWFGTFYDFCTDEDVTACVVSAVSSGTAVVSDAVAGGVLVIANSGTTDDSGAGVQVDASPHNLSAGAVVEFKTRVKQSDATQSDLWTGLFPLDTTIIAGVTGGVYFRKDDGDAYWDFVIRAGSADIVVSTAVATQTADAWQELAVKITMDPSVAAKGVVEAYIDGRQVYYGVCTALPASTVYLTPSVAWQSGEAAAKTCHVDYIGARQSR